MNGLLKKIMASAVFLAIVSVVGGFCGAPMAGASMVEVQQSSGIGNVHCGMGDMSDTAAIGNKIPVSDAVMPCCLEKHDNSTTIVPTVLNENIKFKQLSCVGQFDDSVGVQNVRQKTYVSSSSPPASDMLFSNIRLE